jgi:ribosomal protein S8
LRAATFMDFAVQAGSMLVNIRKSLTNIQGAYAAGASHAYVPGGFYSYLTLDLILKGGYIGSFSTPNSKPHSFLVGLRYLDTTMPVWRKFSMFSTPSRSLSLGFHDLRRKFTGSDFLVLSTSVTRKVRYLMPYARLGFKPVVRITGLTLISDALSYRVGGQLLFMIY